MSDSKDHAPSGQAAPEVHEGPIKTPKQLILTVVASFVIPIVVIILLVNFVDFGARTGAGSDGLEEEAVARRIQPVGDVTIRLATAAGALRSGEQVYQAQCAACHATGIVGSPKLADAAAWGPRIKTGYEALLNSALKGKGAMTPQGGGEFNETEIGRAVVYMANQGGAKFDEPKAPASAASAGAGAAASAPN
ncbi:MAG: c-type cytochrome [Rubrivivax sp.]|nr:c-type cytochrome [Rubrivivax sp.]